MVSEKNAVCRLLCNKKKPLYVCLQNLIYDIFSNIYFKIQCCIDDILICSVHCQQKKSTTLILRRNIMFKNHKKNALSSKLNSLYNEAHNSLGCVCADQTCDCVCEDKKWIVNCMNKTPWALCRQNQTEGSVKLHHLLIEFCLAWKPDKHTHTQTQLKQRSNKLIEWIIQSFIHCASYCLCFLKWKIKLLQIDSLKLQHLQLVTVGGFSKEIQY